MTASTSSTSADRGDLDLQTWPSGALGCALTERLRAQPFARERQQAGGSGRQSPVSQVHDPNFARKTRLHQCTRHEMLESWQGRRSAGNDRYPSTAVHEVEQRE